jgi:hypothetical protein
MRLIVVFGCLGTVLLGESHVLQAMAHTFSKEDINKGDMYGETALHAAAFAGREKKIVPLLKNGAEINARDNINETPLHKAVFMNRCTIAELLIDAGADVLAKNNNGETAYDIFEHNRLDSSSILNVAQKHLKAKLEDTMWRARLSNLRKQFNNGAQQTKKSLETAVLKPPPLEQKLVVLEQVSAEMPSVKSVVCEEEGEDLNELSADVMVYRSCLAILRKMFSALMSCGKR